jgi:hypothetical protein
VADSPGQRTTVPDPSVLSTEALTRGLQAERDYADGQIAVLKERLDGIDRATGLLSETVNRVPTVLTQEIGHLTSLMKEKFSSVAIQFKERDTRSEREARDNKLAVDAAFAAQEKQAVAQQESNTLAIAKSEAATAETIKTNQELGTSRTDSLTKGQDELKLAVGRLETSKQNNTEAKVDSRSNSNFIVQVAAVIATILFALLTWSISHNPRTTTVIVPANTPAQTSTVP